MESNFAKSNVRPGEFDQSSNPPDPWHYATIAIVAFRHVKPR